jgi:outer membrane protein assembly factor BamD (BamD/ComL family)
MKVFLLLAVLTAVLACKTGPAVIPEGLTAGELVQRAQEASDRNRYERAAEYYAAILTRFPEDKAAVVGAEYEIAFIQYKQKKYLEAEKGFGSLLARYGEADGAALPQKYFILSNIVLENIKKAPAYRITKEK